MHNHKFETEYISALSVTHLTIHITQDVKNLLCLCFLADHMLNLEDDVEVDLDEADAVI